MSAEFACSQGREMVICSNLVGSGDADEMVSRSPRLADSSFHVLPANPQDPFVALCNHLWSRLHLSSVTYIFIWRCKRASSALSLSCWSGNRAQFSSWLIDPMLRALPLYNNSDVVLKTIFLLLQVCVGGFAVFVRLDTFQKLLTWSLLTIATYILFARIYSPQWALWILPFLVLLACDRFDMALICVYGVVTYLEFPIVYDFMGEASRSMRVMGLLNALLLILIIIRAGVRFVRLHNTERPWWRAPFKLESVGYHLMSEPKVLTTKLV